MKTLHAIWAEEKWNEVLDEMIPAHMECWEYETPGSQFGRYVGDLPGWTHEEEGTTDAIILAHNMAHKNQEPAYAVETRYGWTCATRKPSLRYGKVIECHNGKEYLA